MIGELIAPYFVFIWVELTRKYRPPSNNGEWTKKRMQSVEGIKGKTIKPSPQILMGSALCVGEKKGNGRSSPFVHPASPWGIKPRG
jgi:hypothetical protein